MKRDDFKLRNDHRSRALKLAVRLIDERQCKPLYKRRDALLTDILDEALSVLHHASRLYRTHKEFIEAGIMTETSQLRIGSKTDILLGKAMINPRHGETWPVLSSNAINPNFIVVQSLERSPLTMDGKVLDFSIGDRDRTSATVPSSSLDWILASEVPNTTVSKEVIINALREIEKRIVPSILEAFEAIPKITQVLADCFYYSELIEKFPAASELFDEPAPKVEAETVKEAVTLLQTIS